MTKEELKQYRSIIAELEEIRNQVNDNEVHDIVTGSDIEFPYIEHCMAVSGVPNQYIDTTGLRRGLERQKKSIEEFINSISDSETRRIFRYRYITGKTMPSWTEIAMKIGGGNTSDSIRKKVQRFLKKI